MYNKDILYAININKEYVGYINKDNNKAFIIMSNEDNPAIKSISIELNKVLETVNKLVITLFTENKVDPNYERVIISDPFIITFVLNSNYYVGITVMTEEKPKLFNMLLRAFNNKYYIDNKLYINLYSAYQSIKAKPERIIRNFPNTLSI